MTTFIPSFEQDHFFLLELASILEPLSTQHYDQSYDSITAVLTEQAWNEHRDGTQPTEAVNECQPTLWYTVYWWQCTISNTIVDWNSYEFQKLFDYDFFDDYTIYTGHHLDLY